MTVTVRGARAALAGVAVAALLTAAAVAPATAATPAGRGPHEATRTALEAAVRDGVPGATARAVDAYGTWDEAVGTGDLATGEPRGAHDHYRIGSITKTFVATVVLQLEAEGRLSLDDTVDHWLPGVVSGHGNDGRRVTLRQLLNHTSGIFNVTQDPGFQRQVFTTGFLRHRYRTWTPAELVAVALGHAPDFAPGTGWSYSNTNYLLAGMIIEKATGHTYADEITRRVIQPLRLTGTRVPGTDPGLPGPAARAYSHLADPATGAPTPDTYDVTALNPSMAGSAGEMVSDSADLDRFYAALLGGRLLPPAQLREMTTTVATDPERPDLRYGLGLLSWTLSCGTTVFGHDGGIHGSESVAAVTPDGRRALAYNYNADWADTGADPLTSEFCPPHS